MRKADSSSYLTDEESIRTRTALFNKYVYPYRNLIYHICIKQTRDNDNIADNYNEVLINFFRYVHSYDPTREVKTWIYAITVRMLADLERKNNRFAREGDVGQ
ncbi:sigma factor [Bacteroides sp. CR5/BHMF/2]|nr:sigma factor [Bacteroides sp. CR5/BHMF/2]